MVTSNVFEPWASRFLEYSSQLALSQNCLSMEKGKINSFYGLLTELSSLSLIWNQAYTWKREGFPFSSWPLQSKTYRSAFISISGEQ